MNATVIAPASTVKSETRQSWDRMDRETSRAFATFLVYRDLGGDRTIQKAADSVQKSGAVLRRWAVRFNWRNRALAFDEHNDMILQRERVKMRVRFQERALKIANKLEDKVERAVDELQLMEKVEGKDAVKVTASPGELARLLELSLEIQQKILGDGKKDRVAAIHVHIGARDPDYDFEQPEAMAEARRKADEAERPPNPHNIQEDA